MPRQHALNGICNKPLKQINWVIREKQWTNKHQSVYYYAINLPVCEKEIERNTMKGQRFWNTSLGNIIPYILIPINTKS